MTSTTLTTYHNLESHLSNKERGRFTGDYSIDQAMPAQPTAVLKRKRKRVAEDRNIKSYTKWVVYPGVVTRRSPYGGKTRTTFRGHLKSIQQCNQRYVRNILQTKQDDRQPNISFLIQTSANHTKAMIITYQLGWYENAIRVLNAKFQTPAHYSLHLLKKQAPPEDEESL